MSTPAAAYISPDYLKMARWKDNILSFPIQNSSHSLIANSYYFGHPVWARNYLAVVHRDQKFQERWFAVTGSWQDKIVVDIGCAPGNVYASLRDRVGVPKLLLGVDVSRGGLAIAQELGYVPILADAQKLPLKSGFADLVVLNAALHHCDDMPRMLAEAARLVRPGGLLVTDQDLQQTMWCNNWIAHAIWNLRLPIYRFLKRGGHTTGEEQHWCQATEVHHMPGDGVTETFFREILEPMGFEVNLYPHNLNVGAEVLQSERGKQAWNVGLAQRLSGRDPDSVEGALVMLCVAKKDLAIPCVTT
ncbi:class I SAM-dependent methyltransferase [Leptolyngbya sp. FACHB-541]|uniref:class I SAM-dependent methyltransferase n=1 Tax=Leptolyngbya sp. FACHB-541 TaxID=2692810 RepID=UPI001F553E5E|nr:class I SAM-dependent methyltransferase [Leptolyngbya sp. FACHB-541]